MGTSPQMAQGIWEMTKNQKEVGPYGNFSDHLGTMLIPQQCQSLLSDFLTSRWGDCNILEIYGIKGVTAWLEQR